MSKKNKKNKFPKSEQHRIAHFNANALAVKLFADFQAHPEDLGARFSWDDYPDTVAGLARVNCFTWFPHTTKITKALESFAAGVAYNAAQTCLENLQKAEKPSNE